MVFRHSICNEAFDKWPFVDACRAIRKAGYTGIEIAPFTLAETPAEVTAGQRVEYRDIIASEGLTFVGLHWLMLSPKGLHVSGPDEALRRRSWDHIRALIDLCADLGPDGVLVFGSPNQRKTTGGLTREQATRNYVDGLASVAPQAEAAASPYWWRPFRSPNPMWCRPSARPSASCARSAAPRVRTMFDVHNAVDELEPHAVLVDRYFEFIRHVHVNELDGRHCGAGNYDFGPVFEVLQRRGYPGWVSLEAFDFTPGAERLANESLRHLESQIHQLQS